MAIMYRSLHVSRQHVAEVLAELMNGKWPPVPRLKAHSGG